MLKLEWNNNTGKAALKVAAFCNLRARELSGLRACYLDLDADILHVRHSWNDTDVCICPKNSDARDITIDHKTLL